MTDEDKPNGEGAPPPFDPMKDPSKMTEQELAQMQFQQAVIRTAMLAMGAAAAQVQQAVPQARAMQIAENVMNGMPGLGQALQDMSSPESRKEHPYWGYKITARGGTIWPNVPQGTSFGGVVPKDSALLTDPQDVLIFMILTMACLTPTIHAWCAYNGLSFEIFQTAKVPPKQSKLILPH